MRLPLKENILPINNEDPLPRYYQPFPINWVYIKRLRMVLDCLGNQKYHRILEVGYGSGVFLPALSKKGKVVYGVDIHTKVNTVRQMFKKEGIWANISTGNIMSLPYPDQYFDALVCVSTLEHIKKEDLKEVYSEIKRVVRPGGVIALGFPSDKKIIELFFKIIRRNWHFSSGHCSNPEDIIKTLGSNFSIKEIIKWPKFFPFYYACKCYR